jgi:hypothetical protein
MALPAIIAADKLDKILKAGCREPDYTIVAFSANATVSEDRAGAAGLRG